MNDLRSRGLQPINDLEPCGSSVRDHPDFERLQSEIAKLTNPSENGSPDWEQAVKLSSALMADNNDILVASYLAGALLATRGLDGLCYGAQTLENLLATHWEQLYPPVARRRARRNAIQWLIDRALAHAEEHDWSSWPPQDPTLVDGLLSALAGIDRVLAENDSDAPSLQPLCARIGMLRVATIEPSAPAPTSGIATPGLQPSLAGSPAVQADKPTRLAVDSSDSAIRAAEHALDRLATIGNWYAQNDPSNAFGFRLRRMGVWAGIEYPPIADGAQTKLPGPIPALQDALRDLQSCGAHEDMIGFAEIQVLRYPFWLDLNYATAAALGELDDVWSAARHEVCNETANFVSRLQGIKHLNFANGVPFANADTVQWLDSLASPGGNARGDGTADPLAAVQSRARALAANNDLRAAARCLQDAIDTSTAVAGRLRLRKVLCELLLENRPHAKLDAFARGLVEEIDRYSVASWDPELAADALSAAYAILSRNEQNEAETDALLSRIALLNVAIAVPLIT
ncbi:type VI secretion system protein VasJ [Paraburkholderia youngii]|uniref:type VI secretion system protein TssA n=1 Tax=Paraburkholderia youngii TaxID=2782701 RepID=UPI003D2382DF